MKLYHNNILLLDIAVDDSSVRYRSIMQDNNITLNFSTVEPVTVPVGSYCEFEGQRYTLFYPENFKKHNTRNFEYTLVLHSNQEALKLYKFKDLSAKPYRLKFPLTAKPYDFIKLLVDNLNQNDSGWSVGGYLEADDKLISFNHESCYDVLNRIAQEFNTEWEIENKTIHLRKIEKYKDDPLPLSYGKGNGFKSGVGRSNEGDKQPIGRLYVQGGERNIDYSTYNSQTLLLPKGASLEYEGKTYHTDADGMYITRAGNNNVAEDSYDASEMYPKRVGTISDVIEVDADKHFYDIIDTSIPEALNYRDYRIAGEKATIIFQSGALAGREFDILQTDTDLTGYDHELRKFEIVPQELDGMTMPGGVFVPAVGDKYAIFNISMPQAYISDDETKSGASWDMFREAVKIFSENEEARFSFRGELDGVWSRNKWLEIGGKITLGGHILFSDPQFQPDGVKIRITSIKDYVNIPHKPEITLSNAPVSGSFGSTLGKLEAEEVVIERNRKEGIQYTKRQWRDTKETMSMLQDSLLNFSNGINPITIQTMQLIAGDESLQFRFVNSKTAPIQIAHAVTFNKANKQLTANSGIIQHMTIGIDKISPTHKPADYKFWDIAKYISPPLNENKPYYLYAKCSKTSQAGTFLLSTTAIELNSVSGFYHLLMGVINSEVEGDRSIGMLYGFSEITPARITTPVLASPDGEMYIDLLNKVIKGNIKFVSGGKENDLGDWAGGVKDEIKGVDEKIDNLEIGTENIIPNSVIMKWEGITKGADTFGSYYQYKSLPIHSTNLSQGIIFKENMQYVLKINVRKLSGTNPSFIFVYTDGTNSSYSLYNNEEPEIFNIISEKGKTVDYISHRHNVNGVNRLYNIQIIEGNKKINGWLVAPEDIQLEISNAQNTASTALNNVGELDEYVDNAFKDGVISEAEAKAIATYINNINDSMAKAEASYLKVFANTYLEGTAKTTLGNAKINLWGQRDTLINTINNAIADGKTTIAEKNAVDAQFNTFNNLMSAFQSALEDANKAIQKKLDDISKGYVDDLEIGTINLIKRTDVLSWRSLVNFQFSEGSDSFGHYYRYRFGSLTSELDAFPNLKFKEKTQYVVSVQGIIESGRGCHFRFKYTDGTESGRAYYDGNESLKSSTIISEKGKTVDSVFHYHNNNGIVRLYNIQLTEGNKPINGWLTAPEDIQDEIDNIDVGTRNLILRRDMLNWTNRTWGSDEIGDYVEAHISNIGDQPFPSTKFEPNTQYRFTGTTKWISGNGNGLQFKYSDGTTSLICRAWDSIPVSSFDAISDKYKTVVAIERSWSNGGSTRYYEMMLVRGNKKADYNKAPEDVQDEINKAQADANELLAKTKGFTKIGGIEFDSGLIFSSIIKLFDVLSGNETAGISGILGTLRNNPSFWSGGTYVQAMALVGFLAKVATGTTPSVGEYNSLAKITTLHNGAAKIGDFIIEESGRILMIDPDTGGIRLMYTTSNLPKIEDLVNGINSNGGMDVGTGYLSGATSSSVTLSGSTNVTKAGAEVTFSGATISLSGSGTVEPNGMAGYIEVGLRLYIDNVPNNYLGGAVIYFSSPIGQDTLESDVHNIPPMKFTLNKAGVVTFKLESISIPFLNSRLNSASITTSRLDWTHVVQGVKRQQYGLDGMMFAYSNRHFHYTEEEGVDIRERVFNKFNAPGVLASGTVASNGSQSNVWGAKSSMAGTTALTGGRKVPLANLMHSNYTVMITPHTNTTFRVGAKSQASFEAYGTGAFDYVVLGNNYP